MKYSRYFFVAICLIIGIFAWIVIQKVRGPTLPGYQVIEQTLVQTVVATGRIAAVSRAQVSSPVTGVILERRVREGDSVKPGSVLAILRADDLEAGLREAEAALTQLQQTSRPQAQASLREAQSRLAQASREANRRRDLFRQRMITNESMEQAIQIETAARTAFEQAQFIANSLATGSSGETAARARLANAKAQLAKTTIRAEVAGTVLTRNAEPGDLAQPGRVLFEIARSGDTEVLMPLDEKNLEVLAIGQAATCIADAFPSRPFSAKVSFIAPGVDAQRGTIDVRLSVMPVPDFVRQGMTVSVNVETGRRDRALVVTNDALNQINGANAKLWIVENGRAVQRNVKLGLRGLTQTEVTTGLRARDWVLTTVPPTLVEGDRVRVQATSSSVDPATRKEIPVKLD
jgi:HlyD family secretion protein